MTNQIHRTLLITPEYRDAALALIVAAAGEAQAGMLQTAVGAGGDEPTVTHYMSTGNILTSFASLLPLDEWDGEQYVRVQEPDFEAIIAASGGAVTQEQLEPILSAAVITAESWRVTLGNLNLVIMGEAE